MQNAAMPVNPTRHDGINGCQCPECQNARIKAASAEFMAATAADAARISPKAFAADAVRVAQTTVEHYKQRLADEQTMADTVATGSDEEVKAMSAEAKWWQSRTYERQEEVRQLQKDNAVLVTRIEELEAAAQKRGDTAGLLDLLARIAYVLRTFYYAELSLSSVQPIIALAMELNPEIVEHKR